MTNAGNKIKKMRHMRILELIESKDVETQEELMNLLRASGFDVTQATVSRDIRELKLTKATDKKERINIKARPSIPNIRRTNTRPCFTKRS